MCKYEHYGNCDPETRDQEYCIFHKPDKTEDEAREFYRKFLERFKPQKRKELVIDDLDVKEVEGLIFEDDVDCRRYVFPEVPDDVDFSFKCATFKGRAVFEKVTFEGNVVFEGAIFERAAMFSEVTFEGDAVFEGAIFEGIAVFNKATFKRDAVFEYAIFKDDICLGESKFYRKLKFSYISFPLRAIYLDLPSECFKHPQAEAEACRIQRIFYEREGRRDDADRMFVRERRALRRLKVLEAREELKIAEGLKSKIVVAGTLLKTYVSSAIEYVLADLTCRYGTDWKRPVILWVALVIFVFPFIYCLTHSVSRIHGTKIDSIWNCLYFSVVTATTLGYGDLHPVGWGKAIASAEAIFGMFMWAVFLAVFSRKYMR